MANAVNVASQYYLHDYNHSEGKFTNKERKQLQHEFKIYSEKYIKELIGKGSDSTKVIIWNDMVILRGEGFLTEPEKYIARDSKGCNIVKAARLQVAKQVAIDNVPYYEKKLGATCIHHSFDIDSLKDYWMYIMVFDQLLIDNK